MHPPSPSKTIAFYYTLFRQKSQLILNNFSHLNTTVLYFPFFKNAFSIISLLLYTKAIPCFQASVSHPLKTHLYGNNQISNERKLSKFIDIP